MANNNARNQAQLRNNENGITLQMFFDNLKSFPGLSTMAPRIRGLRGSPAILSPFV